MPISKYDEGIYYLKGVKSFDITLLATFRNFTGGHSRMDRMSPVLRTPKYSLGMIMLE